jgi:hypothetical protein
MLTMEAGRSRAFLAGLVLTLVFSFCLRATAQKMLDPKATEHVRQALAKIAPLERWQASWERERPEICWQFFRPDFEHYATLIKTINQFQGRMNWTVVGNCLFPGFGKTVVAPPVMAVPNAGGIVMQKQTMDEKDVAADLTGLAQSIERMLRLADTKPFVFLPEMLTREGLRNSKGQFEDFLEGGELTVYLIVHPGSAEHFGTTKDDFFLHFAPFDNELTAIFDEILETDLAQDHGRAMTDQEIEHVKTKYPTFWKISDYYEGGYLSPAEAKRLLEECTALSEKAKSPASLRGLDKLIRIANWGASKGYGVYFEPP